MHLLLDPAGARLMLFLLVLAVAPLVLMIRDRRRREGARAARRDSAWRGLAWAAPGGSLAA